MINTTQIAVQGLDCGQNLSEIAIETSQTGCLEMRHFLLHHIYYTKSVLQNIQSIPFIVNESVQQKVLIKARYSL